MDSYTNLADQQRFYIHLFCTDMWCCLHDLPGGRDDEDGWWEKARELHLSARLDDNDDKCVCMYVCVYACVYECVGVQKKREFL